MSCEVVWNIILSCCSFVLALIAIVTAVKTLKQNNRMIESSTRPYICVYGETIIVGSKPQFLFIIKNYGSSAATLRSFQIDEDLSGCYSIPNSRDFLSDISGCILAPGQSRCCRMDYSALPDLLHISIEYSSSENTYSESFEANVKAGAALLSETVSSEGSDLTIISRTLQEMLKKNL